jgi:hypothetical protein
VSGDERPILIDAPDASQVDKDFIASLGHEVTTCAGPQEGPCPLVDGGTCELAEGAHVIVFMLDLANQKDRKVLEAYRSKLKEDLPIGVVVKDRTQALENADLLSGLRVWADVPGVGDLDALVAEVDASEE